MSKKKTETIEWTVKPPSKVGFYWRHIIGGSNGEKADPEVVSVNRLEGLEPRPLVRWSVSPISVPKCNANSLDDISEIRAVCLELIKAHEPRTVLCFIIDVLERQQLEIDSLRLEINGRLPPQ